MRSLLGVMLVLVFGAGCSSTPDPDTPRITLFAIDPGEVSLSGFDLGEGLGRVPEPPGHDLAKGYFHSYKILGRVDLTGTDRGAQLARFLQEEAELPQGLISGCFEPRHGLRVEQGGTATDYVICFTCQQFDWYAGPKLEWAGKQALFDRSWYDRFTDPLTQAGIELAD